MAIVGITVSENGESIQRLAVSTKISIGEVRVKTDAAGKPVLSKDTGKPITYPGKLDHFDFKRKVDVSKWEKDPDLTSHFGESCKEIMIILMDDNVENIFKTELAMWNATEKFCSGDGRDAIRHTAEHPEGEPWHPCGDACPERQKRLCKPSGDLYCVLADFPALGRLCRLHTSGRRSIQQIYSALEQIRTVTGGRLAGLRVKAVVRPEKTTYFDEKEQKKRPTTIYAINLEVTAQDMRQLMDKMTEHARLFDQTRKLLGSHTIVIDEESDDERAADIAAEFYPEKDILSAPAVAQPERASAAKPAAPTTESASPKAPMAPPAATLPPAEPATTTIPSQKAASEPKPANGGPCITRDQRHELYVLTTDMGWSSEEATKALKQFFGVDSSAKLPASRFEEALNYFRNPDSKKDGWLPDNLFPGEQPK